jgi:hypothetical protein
VTDPQKTADEIQRVNEERARRADEARDKAAK